MKTHLFSILTIFASYTLGWDPSQRDCSKSPLCLTSFRWCDRNGAGCYYPEGAYPGNANSDPVIYALILEDKNYEISWKVAGRNADVPVRVRWAQGERSSWEINTTSTHFIFNPRAILSSFPISTAPNLTVEEAEHNAWKDMTNIITIDQPSLRDDSEGSASASNAPFDTSDQFIVAVGETERFLKAQYEIGRRDDYNKWKLGVGIGVGLGVPILMAITALSTWVVLKKGASRNQEFSK
ncbi:hypothetical protein K445DRAFT_300557 [Daldinia sp. EC12]|nr:hypothetical protein K445DRAFT_300557 [Daldinia sp. EC12]